jgi:hypothetical protein
MSYPEQALLKKRRRQILDDETGDGHRLDTLPPDDTSDSENAWAKNFVVRLGAVIRSIGGKKQD